MLRHALISSALVAGLALSAGSARAADYEGAYISLGAGWNVLLDSDTRSPVGVTNEIDFDDGFAGTGAVGYATGTGWRGELEVGYRDNDVDAISGVGAAAPFTGDFSTWSIMGNLLYDFNTGWALTPYLGAGVGMARISADNVGTVLTTSINESDSVIAYQGIAGLSYALTPRLDLDLSYRFFGTDDPDFESRAGVTGEGEYHSHTLLAGLRYMLTAPPAAPASAPMQVSQPVQPAPPPAPAETTWLVFFDWDKSDLKADAKSTLDKAAASLRSSNVTRIVLTGHADRSGPSDYNMALSLRRAEAVKKYLSGLGIPASAIALVAKGESDPLVPTADGVREPQNRRVEIVFQ